jgi:hypothetical protein
MMIETRREVEVIRLAPCLFGLILLLGFGFDSVLGVFRGQFAQLHRLARAQKIQDSLEALKPVAKIKSNGVNDHD